MIQVYVNFTLHDNSQPSIYLVIAMQRNQGLSVLALNVRVEIRNYSVWLVL